MSIKKVKSAIRASVPDVKYNWGINKNLVRVDTYILRFEMHKVDINVTKKWFCIRYFKSAFFIFVCDRQL